MFGCTATLADLHGAPVLSSILCVWGREWVLLTFCLFAGLIDSIGGGGGLISVPALLAAGVPPVFVLGTNKSVAALGSMVAVTQYARAGLLPTLKGSHWVRLVAVASLAGVTGAAVAQLSVITTHLRIAIPFLLVAVMAFLAKKWFWTGPAEAKPAVLPGAKGETAMIGAIASYDGLFGPGVGTLYLSWLEKCGHPTIQANAMTKVLNLSSNLGALAFFAWRGRVLWPVGLACAVAMMLGNGVGSSLVVSRGKVLVRVTVLGVTSMMLVKLLVLG